MRSWFVVLISGFPLLAVEPTPKQIEFFENKIRPVLVEQCQSCHGEKKQQGGLRVDSKADLRKGGDSGPALVPGKASASLLVKVLKHEGDTKMPPKAKLPDRIVADFSMWIDDGAADPREGAAATSEIDWAKAKEFWAFKPVVKPALPGMAGQPIDRFVLAKLQEQKLIAMPLADKATLLRRVTFDLTGLPPSPEDVAAFMQDSSEQAYAKLVDRLLQSPAYGEMQARHWLDVARYAEDQAHTFAVTPNTNAYRYRDWAIQAFNEDMPYNRFVQLQIAADQLTGDGADDIRHRAALGLFGLGAIYYKNSDAAKAAADELDDRVDTLTRGFLGLTVSCARCHDHKFDPIPTQDYYSLAGIFWSSKITNLSLGTKEEIERQTASQKKIADMDKAIKDFVQKEKDRVALAKIDKIPEYVTAAWRFEAAKLAKPDTKPESFAKTLGLDGPTLNRLVAYLNRKGMMVMGLNDWAKHLPKEATAMIPAELAKLGENYRDYLKTVVTKPNEKNRNEVMQAMFGDKGVFPISETEALAAMPMERKTEYAQLKQSQSTAVKNAPPALPIVHGLTDSTPTDLKVYLRGNPAKQGDVAPRRFLQILGGEQRAKFTQGSGRKELAAAITDPKNPLTARVMVNRIWQQHFGRGIVGTPSNFGSLGERPTHPELLDYLAATFVENGWSIKKLHREIVLSETYRRAATPDTKNNESDADNRFLWRGVRRRLNVEPWRDALLAVSGRLDRSLGGPTTNLDSADNVRRTVYAKISRHELNGLLRLFDFPDANITSDKRSETTVPQQQLFVMNSPFMVNQAKALAARLEKEASDDRGRIQRAYLLAFSRTATAAEIELGERYLKGTDSATEAAQNKLNRRERYCQALLASNEFLYVD